MTDRLRPRGPAAPYDLLFSRPGARLAEWLRRGPERTFACAVRLGAIIDGLHLPVDLTDEDRARYERRVGEDPVAFGQANRRALRFGRPLFPEIIAAAPTSPEQLDDLCSKRGALVRLRAGVQQIRSDAEDGGLVALAMTAYLEAQLREWLEAELAGELPEKDKQVLRGEFAEYLRLLERQDALAQKKAQKSERDARPLNEAIFEAEDRVLALETKAALQRGEEVAPERVLAAAEIKRRPAAPREEVTAAERPPAKPGGNRRGKKR